MDRAVLNHVDDFHLRTLTWASQQPQGVNNLALCQVSTVDELFYILLSSLQPGDKQRPEVVQTPIGGHVLGPDSIPQ